MHAPELSLGMQTGDEVHDAIDAGTITVPAASSPARALEAALLETPEPAQTAVEQLGYSFLAYCSIGCRNGACVKE